MSLIIEKISPEPTPLQEQKIVAAINEAWPKPAVLQKQSKPAWRFNSRWWNRN